MLPNRPPRRPSLILLRTQRRRLAWLVQCVALLLAVGIVGLLMYIAVK